MDIEDLIHEEDVVIILTANGYIKRVPLDEYKSQKRGGKGLIGMKMKEEDIIYKTAISSTHDYILFFSADGKVFAKKAYEIPYGGRHSKGRAVINLIRANRVVDILPLKNFDGSLMMATKKGVVKKISLKLLSNIRANGVRAIKLREGDELIGAKVIRGGEKVVLATRNGFSCIFDEKEVREMGRNAEGVRGIKLYNDEAVSIEVINDEDLLTITENGYGKRTDLKEYRITKRGAKGIITIKTNERNGKVAGVIAVKEDNDVLIASKNGMMVRIKAKDIKKQGRNTMGVRIMRLNKDDKVVSIVKI